MRFDARPGGGLCEGQQTELRLETSADLHVRVVNLFGDGSRGMVIWAPAEAVKAQSTQSLGKFDVVKAGDVPAERFLVVGAQKPEQLGVLANVKAPCRLAPQLATQFSANRGLPAGTKDYTTSRSYRVLSGEECSSFSPKQLEHNWFEQYPLCN